jgi:nitrate/nitrite transporter NarK
MTSNVHRFFLGFYSAVWVFACSGLIALAWNDTKKLDIDGGNFDLEAFITTDGATRWAFTALMFVMGMAWAFGKASVFKYISDDYPGNIGVISGIVGLAGGLGGFLLPVLFGVLLDLTGVRSSCFMLMYGVVWVSLIWMYLTEVRRIEVMGPHAT